MIYRDGGAILSYNFIIRLKLRTKPAKMSYTLMLNSINIREGSIMQNSESASILTYTYFS
jgi:hypothetical protein